MQSRITVWSLIALLALALIAGTGCKPKVAEVEPPPPEPPPTRQPPPERQPPLPRTPVEPPGDFEPKDVPSEPIYTRGALIDLARKNLPTVYFAFDSYDLTPSSQITLRSNAEWLKAHKDLNLVVEGHCDERGTIEYNLALGERRASSVRDYLATLGVNRSRIRIITYGEERPVDPGHTEAAWSQNRRAQFGLERM